VSRRIALHLGDALGAAAILALVLFGFALFEIARAQYAARAVVTDMTAQNGPRRRAHGPLASTAARRATACSRVIRS